MKAKLDKKKLLKKSAKPLLIVLSALLILSLTAVVFTYQLPVELEIKRNIASYKQEATYTCVAKLHPNIIYETTILPLKDKVFLRLVKNINVTFTYSFKSSPLGENTSIVYEPRFIVESPGLWSKSFNLQEPIKVNSTIFTYNTSINMGWVNSLIANITREIGVHTSKCEILIITDIYLSTNLAGRNLTKHFTPMLRLTLEYGSGIITISGLSHEDKSTITETNRKEAYLQAFGFTVKVSDARMISQSLSIASIAALGFMLFMVKPKLGEQNKLKTLIKKYSDIIIDVDEPPNTSSLIRVNSLKDLFKIAQGIEKPVLHVNKGEIEEFYVVGGSDTYYYSYDVKKAEEQSDI